MAPVRRGRKPRSALAGEQAQASAARGEAQAYIDAYFKKYPGIRAYMDTTKELARRQGFVTTLYGRKCHVTGINDKNTAARVGVVLPSAQSQRK